MQRINLEIEFAGSAPCSGFFDLGDGDGGGISFVRDDHSVHGKIFSEGEEDLVTDFGGLAETNCAKAMFTGMQSGFCDAAAEACWGEFGKV